MTLRRLLKEAILEESADVNDVTSAIDNHTRVIINYHSKGDDKASGPRVIEVYAYGVTSAGNPVIRAFQPYGDTTSKVPSWKMFRLDRIVEWQPTEQHFSKPASDYYGGVGSFNPNGDNTMASVYKVAKFGDDDMDDNAMKKISKSGTPKMNDVFKTDTERRMERTREQLSNPIKLSDLQNSPKEKSQPGPQLNNSAEAEKVKEPEEIFRTDTERGLDNLAKQLENPRKIDLSKFEKNKQEEPEEEIDDTFKTDTERGLDSLAKQLENPRKIDLSKIPKR